MKIIFLAPHLRVSGGVRVLLKYADILAARNHDVTVIVQSKKWLRRTLANFLNWKPYWFKNIKADILRIADFGQGQILSADIIVVSDWGSADKIRNLPAANCKKFYLLQHDERLYHGNREEVEKIYQLPFEKIAVSSWLADIVRNDFKQKAHLLLNSFDRKLFYSNRQPKKEGAVRILLLHHLYRWKGTEEGVRVVSILKEKYPNIKLVLFGAREEKINLPYDEYYFDLPQNKLAWLFSSCDIFLCPSWDEGFGLPSLEAMACGCALVTYDNGGSRDFAFDGKTALVAKRKDELDLLNKLETLVKNKEARERIAEEGYRFAQKMATWENQSEKLEKIFLETLNNA